MVRKSRFGFLALILILLGSASPVHAVSSVTSPYTPALDSPPLIEFNSIANGLSLPVSITNAGDGSGRLFITLQGGQIVIHDGTQILPTPFLNVASLISSGGERGLLSAAFHPGYASNGYFYIYYTRASDGAIVIARYHTSADPNVADPASGNTLMVIPHPGAANHNGGQLQFGPDGYLYIGTGDGGTGGANSQNGNSLLGKILRIDVNSDSPYAIPASNPFVSDSAVADEIWALGLRNPWRFSFDRSTGDLFIADVGQNDWEEIDFQTVSSSGGQNYGWPCYEGNHIYNSFSDCTAKGTLTYPVTEYNHGASDSIGCSVSGGYVYRGSEYPGLFGAYLYGDLCTGRVWGVSSSGAGDWASVELASTGYIISTFGEDEVGNLYVADYGNGNIYRILASTFSDVSPSHWAWSWIERLYRSEITSGCTASPLRYCPEDPVTRAQMAVFLERGIHGALFTPSSPTGIFGDVSPIHWAASWIESLYADGITVGCGGGNYCPEQYTSRAEMSVFLLRAEHGSAYSPPPASGTVFTDVPPSYWAAAWIEQLAAEGITGGCGTNLFCPDNAITRAEMAVFLVKTFNLP
ncbi:MAG: PQQ-dependent sugar dehydrogenase [Chloroflexi bacterium]|nr:PQQ-dependent sugar dehydrogenase [Chloroflexota bacterium]